MPLPGKVSASSGSSIPSKPLSTKKISGASSETTITPTSPATSVENSKSNRTQTRYSFYQADESDCSTAFTYPFTSTTNGGTNSSSEFSGISAKNDHEKKSGHRRSSSDTCGESTNLGRVINSTGNPAFPLEECTNSAASSGVEDILRSLAETEHLGLHEHYKDSTNTFSAANNATLETKAGAMDENVNIAAKKTRVMSAPRRKFHGFSSLDMGSDTNDNLKSLEETAATCSTLTASLNIVNNRTTKYDPDPEVFLKSLLDPLNRTNNSGTVKHEKEHVGSVSEKSEAECLDEKKDDEKLSVASQSSKSTTLMEPPLVEEDKFVTDSKAPAKTEKNPYEKALRDALNHIRSRGQKRTALLKSGSILSQEKNSNSYLIDGLSKGTKGDNTANGPSIAKTQMQSDQEETVALLLAKEEEWKARRARMATYAARLSNNMYRITASSSTAPPTSHSNNISNNTAPSIVGRSSSNSTLPLPLHPSERRSTSTTKSIQLVPATQLDNRLLSPAVDVRKTVAAGSGSEMFRPYLGDIGTLKNGEQTTGQNGAPLIGLALANPVYSQTTPGREHAVHSPEHGTANILLSDDVPVPPLFSVVPSSPAPGKLQSVQARGSNTTANEATRDSLVSKVDSASNVILRERIDEIEGVEVRKTELEIERRWRREEEVEKGVEQVLLAILERAGKQVETSKQSVSKNVFTNDKVFTQINEEEEDGGELIEKAFSSLFCKDLLSKETPFYSAPSFIGETIRDTSAAVEEELANGNAAESKIENAATKSSSVIEQFLDKEDAQLESKSSKSLNYSINSRNDVPILNNGLKGGSAELISKQPGNHLPPLSPLSREELRVGGGQDSKSVQSHKDCASHLSCDASTDGMIQVENVHSGVISTNTDNDSQAEEYGNRVLGPLSKKMGGTTGVVLDNESNKDCDPLDSDEVPNDSAPVLDSSDNLEDSVTSSLFGSIKSAVRKGPSDIIAALSGESSQASYRRQDRYSSADELDDHEVSDRALNAFMRNLYAHLLPYGVDKSDKKRHRIGGWLTGKLQESWSFDRNIPGNSWDDEDPEELGYIVHKLSPSQLHRVEQDFERMVNRVRQNSERQLLDRNIRAQRSPNRNLRKNAQSLNGKSDHDFERDLEEAEIFLEKEEERQRVKEKSTSDPDIVSDDVFSNDEDDIPSKSDGEVSSSVLSLDDSDHEGDNPLTVNPWFPNAKPAGTGKLGELEIYHLPIIYKAHQTGFEPTKDLVLQPGTVFAGQYFVQNELGSAAFSTAYRCVDLNSGKKAEDGEEYYDEVCLKVIKNTKDFFDQSLDEIKILELLRQTGKCQENNILEMQTFFYHKEHLIIVTELLRQNLFEFGKYIMENNEPRYFTRNRLCYIARQCLVALSFVHKLGLVHSDIKPENILLASYSKAKVKVIDFGSSCYLTDRQSSYIQSRSYRAPEVILGLPYDGKIDIWSLGCVIAEMYTGQVTFQNDSVVSMLSRIEAICGAFPRHMVQNGRQSGQFFTTTGLLYEKFQSDDDSDMRRVPSSAVDEDDISGIVGDTYYKIYQPKMTTMAARLGFESNLMERRRTTWEDDEKALFVDFVRKTLTIDPDCRPSATEALEHPWILSGFNLTESDIKYPPEE